MRGWFRWMAWGLGLCLACDQASDDETSPKPTSSSAPSSPASATASTTAETTPPPELKRPDEWAFHRTTSAMVPVGQDALDAAVVQKDLIELDDRILYFDFDAHPELLNRIREPVTVKVRAEASSWKKALAALRAHEHRATFGLSLDREKSSERMAQVLADLADSNLPELTALNLAWSKLDAAGWGHLSRLAQLRTLAIYGSVVDGTALEQVAKLHHLDELTMGKMAITDDDLKHLAALTSLTKLRLTRSKTSDAGLAHLRPLSKLQWLFLDDTQITSAGLVELSHHPELEWLFLGRTKIDDAGLRHVASLKHIEVLNLWDTRVGDQGMKHLSHLRPVEVQLGKTDITDAGLEEVAHIRSLQRLLLAFTKVTDAGVAQLSDMPELRIINLFDTRVGNGAVATIAALPKAEWFELGRTLVTDVSLKALPQRTWFVGLNGTSVTDEGTKHLGALPHLRHLALARTGVTDAGVARLAGLQELEELHLDDTKITDKSLKHIEALRALVKVNLRGTATTAAGRTALEAARPKLRAMMWTRQLALVCALLVGCGTSGRKSDDDASEEAPSKKKKTKKKQRDNDDDAKPNPTAGMPEACRRAAPPSAADLGLKGADFITCLEKMLARMKLPKEAKKSFVSKGAGTYEIANFMAVKMTEKNDRISSMDVFFFNELRKEHGMTPELGGQYATLAIVFPGAKVNPSQGEAIFKKVDAIGRKTNKPLIDYVQDGIALNASFLPVSVRYRFTPAPANHGSK